MNAIDRLDAWLRISPSTVLPSEVLEYLDDIKAENVKLCAERDEWHRVAKSKQDIIDHMRDANAENAKLQELAAGIGYLLFTLDVDYCAICPRDDINHPCPVHTVNGGECLYEADMRELGIEVPE